MDAVPWPTDVLVAIGFSKSEALQVQAALPPVDAGNLAITRASEEVLSYDHSKPSPVATALWVTYDLDVRDAIRLSFSGRPILELITILNAVDARYPDWLWVQEKYALAEAWAIEAQAPLDRIELYLAAGISAAEAAAFEAGPASRPDDDQLAAIGALRP